MVKEFAELNSRTEKLGVFIGGSPVYQAMTEEEKTLMENQYKAMCDYRDNLRMRMALVGADPFATNGEEMPPTFGEKLVGRTFNPSGDDKVARLKALAAEMADIVNEHNSAGTTTESGYLNSTFKGGAIRRILDAQMWAVKHITNK